MKTSLARRTLFLLPFAAVALYGCPQAEEPADEALADVVFEGDTTDEGLTAMLGALDQKDPVTDAARAPTLDTPSGTEIPKSPIPAFTWHFGAKASFHKAPGSATHALARSVGAPSPGGGLALLPTLLPTPPAQPSWASPLLQLVGPPRAAHAHGDPMNGTATFLVFSTEKDPKLARVFTTETTYTPAQTVWDKLAGAGVPITLSLVAADFDANRVADGGDPVQGTELTFTITP